MNNVYLGARGYLGLPWWWSYSACLSIAAIPLFDLTILCSMWCHQLLYIFLIQ